MLVTQRELSFPGAQSPERGGQKGPGEFVVPVNGPNLNGPIVTNLHGPMKFPQKLLVP